MRLQIGKLNLICSSSVSKDSGGSAGSDTWGRPIRVGIEPQEIIGLL